MSLDPLRFLLPHAGTARAVAAVAVAAVAVAAVAVAAVAVAAVLAGCAAPAVRDGALPAVPVPAGWSSASVTAAPPTPLAAWWQHFDDPQMAALVAQALEANADVCIGVLFGYFPARRAARLDPIEALRHE